MEKSDIEIFNKDATKKNIRSSFDNKLKIFLFIGLLINIVGRLDMRFGPPSNGSGMLFLPLAPLLFVVVLSSWMYFIAIIVNAFKNKGKLEFIEKLFLLFMIPYVILMFI
jgi:hypothetical protein